MNAKTFSQAQSRSMLPDHITIRPRIEIELKHRSDGVFAVFKDKRHPFDIFTIEKKNEHELIHIAITSDFFGASDMGSSDFVRAIRHYPWAQNLPISPAYLKVENYEHSYIMKIKTRTMRFHRKIGDRLERNFEAIRMHIISVDFNELPKRPIKHEKTTPVFG